MREIKFRAWDKENGRMLIPAMPTLGGSMTWGDGSFDSNGKGYVLMQFTGLKDKNGKEILEGDILRIHEGFFERKAGNYQVKWANDLALFECIELRFGGSRALAGFLRDKKDFHGNEVNPTMEIEVIGNIYENPELLKKH